MKDEQKSPAKLIEELETLRTRVKQLEKDVMGRKRAEEHTLRQAAVFRAINKVFQETLVCETVEDVAYTFINMTEELTGSEYGLVGEINEAGRFDTISYGDLGWAICKMPGSDAIALSKNMIIRGIWGQAILKGESQIVNDTTSHPDRVSVPEGHPQIKCFMGVPLKDKGKTIGMIGLANKEAGYKPADQEAVESLSVAFVEALRRKRAEEALKESLAQYRLLIEQSNDAIYLLYQKKFVLINQKFSKMLGVTPEEVRSPEFNFMELVAPKSRQLVEERSRMKERGEKPHPQYEFVVLTRDGKEIEVEASVTDISYREGIAVQGILRDITERKRAEEALRKSEKNYRDLLENLLDGIAVVDPEERFVFANPAALKLFGNPKNGLIGRCFDEFTTPEEFNKILKQTEKRRALMKSTYEATIIQPNGEERQIVISATPQLDDEGNFIGAFNVFKDITETRQLEDQFRQAQKMEAVGRLASGVAHDFNNLLMVISGNTESALMQLSPNDPLQSDLEQVKKAAVRASHLTRQLLAFSRKQVIQPRILNLNSIITDLEKMLRRLIKEDIEFETRLNPDVWSIKVDRGQIEQVIANLTVNARDAMPYGGKLTIETANVELEKPHQSLEVEITPGSYVVLSVKDTGCGMTKELISQIFDPFFTTKPEGEGTGLGLSTVFGVVKQSDGYITVDTELGKGATFKIFLHKAAGKADDSNHNLLTDNLPTGDESVLMVEDEDDVRSMAVRILKRAGYKVKEARNGPEALKICAVMKKPFDLIVTDMIMPMMRGTELIKRVREKYLPNIKALFMSGYTPDDAFQQEIIDKETPYLQKPAGPVELAKKVREVLDS